MSNRTERRHKSRASRSNVRSAEILCSAVIRAKLVHNAAPASPADRSKSRIAGADFPIGRGRIFPTLRNGRRTDGGYQRRNRSDRRRRDRSPDPEFTACECTVAGGARRHREGHAAGDRPQRRQGGRADLRRQNLHRRRRHHRVRQTAADAPASTKPRMRSKILPNLSSRQSMGRRSAAVSKSRCAATIASQSLRRSAVCRKCISVCCRAPAARNACRASSESSRRSRWSRPASTSTRRPPTPQDSSMKSSPKASCVRPQSRLRREIVAEKRPLRKVRDLSDKVVAARGKPEIFENFRKANARKFRGFLAPEYNIRCIEAAVNLPFEEGLGIERKLFMELMTGEQSAAQRYVFFAERQVWKIPDVPEDTPLIPIRKVGDRGRRYDGRRHFHELRQCRRPRDDRRDEAGCARSRFLRHSQELRAQRKERPSHDGRRREAHVAPQRHAQSRGSRGLRSRHRSDLREHGCEEGRVRQARPHREAGRDPRDEHLGARHQRNRDRGEAAGIRHRPALLLACERDAARSKSCALRGPRRQ